MYYNFTILLFCLFLGTANADHFTKFILDLKSDQIEYIDVERYPLHVDYFIAKKMGTFSEYLANYERDKRLLYGTVTFHETQKLWTYSLWEGDKASVEDIEKGYKAVRADYPEALFRPTSTMQELEIAESSLPQITNDALYRQSDFQMLNAADNVGILRLGHEGATDEDIILLQEFVPDVRPVAGIILEHFATPLSHLALRAKGWGIPNASIRNAATLFEEFIGKKVYFGVTSTGYTIRLAEEQEVTKKRPEVILPKPNLDEREIRPLSTLRRKNADAYGAKAANLGAVGQNVPQGIAIPYFYFDEHMKLSGAYREKEREQKIEKIFNYPINKKLLTLFPNGTFVRSSTNGEDLPGYSGAGVYETVPHVCDIKSLEHAIKRVWASAIDVSCAVILQESLNADSAGVLVTKDIFDPSEFMEVYTINASFGLGQNVVEGDMIPEQILYNYDNKGIKILSRASASHIRVLNKTGGTKLIPAPKNQPFVLSDDQVTMLANRAYALRRQFGCEIDIEWLFVDNTLYILQVRPFIN